MTHALCPRRTLVSPAYLVLLAAFAFLTPNLESAEPAAGRDLIRFENEKPVASDWQLTYVRLDQSDWLEQHGYDVSYCSSSDMLTPDPGSKVGIDA